ncbi:DUF1616 domain-containing protein [Candidatus Bathyarchaeota archaeon]|nr:DUF1616 domain-containing protein [Candidatus Bathyarchaeota archaeon]
MDRNSEKDRLAETILDVLKNNRPATVKELANLVKQRQPIPERQILESIMKLQDEGKITFSAQPKPKPTSLADYLQTSATWYWVTLATVATTIAVVFAIPEDLYPWVYIRYVLGTIFVLWLPGYSFIKALFPKDLPFARGLARTLETSEKNLDTIERVALSLGMSLALVPIVGLLLNYTPWGIRLAPILISLLALTIVFSTTAVIRDYKNQKPANAA